MYGTDSRLWGLKTEKMMTLYEMKELVDILSNNQSVWILQDEIKEFKKKLTVKTHNDLYWNPKANLNRLLNLYYLLTTDYQREQENDTFYLPTGLVFAYLSVNRLINTDKRIDTKLLKTVSKIKTRQNLDDVDNYFRAYPNIEIIKGEGITIQRIKYDILEDKFIFGQEVTDEIKSKLGVREVLDSKKTICKVTVTADWKGEYKVGPDVWQVVFEEGVIVIPDNILTNSQDLILLSFPSTLKAIGIRAFFESRIKRLEIPEGVEEIHEQAFSRAELEEVKLPSSLKVIIAEGFSKNTALTKIELSEGIVELQDFVFYGCSKLKHINLPDSIEKIGIGLFIETAIEEIVLPSKMKEIPERMFLRCSELSNVKMPNEIISINREAFAKCEKLKSIQLPEKLQKIGEYAFAFSGIEEITIPKNVEQISHSSFSECLNLRKINFLGKTKTIDDCAFKLCLSLQEIALPEGIESLGAEVFSKCKILEKIELPRGLKEIRSYCFNECSSLKEIRIPDTIEKIGENVFSYTNIQKLVLVGEKINPSIFSKIFYNIQKSTISELKEVVIIILDDENNEKSTISFSGNMRDKKPEEILEELKKKSFDMKHKKEEVEI